MTKKRKLKTALDPERIVNPRYAGTTPGMVAKALMRPVKEADETNNPDKRGGDIQATAVRSSI